MLILDSIFIIRDEKCQPLTTSRPYQTRYFTIYSCVLYFGFTVLNFNPKYCSCDREDK